MRSPWHRAVPSGRVTAEAAAPNSFPVFETRENNVRRNCHPKCVIADDGDLDEHPDNRKPRENERDDEYKIERQRITPRGSVEGRTS